MATTTLFGLVLAPLLTKSMAANLPYCSTPHTGAECYNYGEKPDARLPDWYDVLRNAGPLLNPDHVQNLTVNQTCYYDLDNSYNNNFLNYVWKSPVLTENFKSHDYCVDEHGVSQPKAKCETIILPPSQPTALYWDHALTMNLSKTIQDECYESLVVDSTWSPDSGQRNNVGNWYVAHEWLDSGPEGNGPNYNWHMGHVGSESVTRYANIWGEDEFRGCVTRALERLTVGMYKIAWVKEDFVTPVDGCYRR